MKLLIIALCLVSFACMDGIDLNAPSVPCGDNLPAFETPECECEVVPCPPKRRCLFVEGQWVIEDKP